MPSRLETLWNRIAQALGLRGDKPQARRTGPGKPGRPASGDGSSERPALSRPPKQAATPPGQPVRVTSSKAAPEERDVSPADENDPATGSSAGSREDERVPAGLDAARAAGTTGSKDSDRKSDPLAEKHRAEIDRDFRTVSYGKDDPSGTGRRGGQRHPETPPPRVTDSSSGDEGKAVMPKTASFGGSVVQTEAVRDRSGGKAPAPDTGPVGRRPSPQTDHPHKPDPLVEKHKSQFDRDFRTVDYADLSRTEKAGSSASAGDTGRFGASEQDAARHGEPATASFHGLGSSGSVAGTPDSDPTTKTGTPESEERPSPDAARRAADGGPPRLDAPRDGTPDDLTRIRGIGPTLERRLFDTGIFHIDQIAAWSPDEARHIDEAIGFAGRVEREEWVEQAKGLTAGDRG